MKTLETMSLKFPKLGIKEMREAVGGMYNNGYDEDLYSGGCINPCYVIAEGNHQGDYTDNAHGENHGLSWLAGYYSGMGYDYSSGQGGSGSCGGSYSGYDSGYDSDDIDMNHSWKFGYSITDENVKERIEKAMESLPVELQRQEMIIEIDPNLLHNLGIQGNDAFLHKGYKVAGDNEILTDTLVFNSIESLVEHIREEALHQWQYNHESISIGTAIDKQERAYMEMQVDILDYLEHIIKGKDSQLSNVTQNVFNIHFSDESNKSFFKSGQGWNQISDILIHMSQTEWNNLCLDWRKTPDALPYTRNDDGTIIDMNMNYFYNWGEFLLMFFSYTLIPQHFS